MEKIRAAIKHAIHTLGYTDLREKQAEVLESFVGGHDVFGAMMCLESSLLAMGKACAMPVNL